jgi:hypothetical protein
MPTINLGLHGIAGAKALPPFYHLRGWFAVQGIDPCGRNSCDKQASHSD